MGDMEVSKEGWDRGVKVVWFKNRTEMVGQYLLVILQEIRVVYDFFQGHVRIGEVKILTQYFSFPKG